MDAATPNRYEPVGRCIYCGTRRHSLDRLRLGDEHIVPEGLGGLALLPQSSCGKCERTTNYSEQFCQKAMLGAFRYQLKLPTKRPKDRPKTLPVEFHIGDQIETREIAVEDYPINLLLPFFPHAEMLTAHPQQKSNIEAAMVYPEARTDGPHELFQYDGGPKIFAKFRYGDMVVPTGKTDWDRFARMMAKIAHAFATAELGHGNFEPFLVPAIAGRADFPIQLVVGGDPSVTHNMKAAELKTASRHNLSLTSEVHHGRNYYVVRVQLFGDLGWPRYACVVGAPKGEKQTLVRRFLEATPLTVETYHRYFLENVTFTGAWMIDHLCARCENHVLSGDFLPAFSTVRCSSCGTWNVPSLEERRWQIPYCEMSDLPATPDPRAIWRG